MTTQDSSTKYIHWPNSALKHKKPICAKYSIYIRHFQTSAGDRGLSKEDSQLILNKTGIFVQAGSGISLFWDISFPEVIDLYGVCYHSSYYYLLFLV